MKIKDSNDSIHPLVLEKLKRSSLLALASRSRKAGIFHGIAFILTVFFSPLVDSNPFFCKIIALVFLVFLILRGIICDQNVQQKTISTHWYLIFSLLTICTFSIWSLWITTELYIIGLNSSTYFCALLLAGLCSGAAMGLAPSRALTSIVVSITLLPPIIMLISLQNMEAYALAIIFGMNIIYLLSLSKLVTRDYRNAIVNSELSNQNRRVIEGILNSVPGFVSCIDHDLNYIWANKRLNEQFGVDFSKEKKKLGAFNLDKNFPNLIRKFIESKKEIDQLEHEMIMPGGPCWMMVFLSSYQEFNEPRVLIVAYDIQSNKTALQEHEKQRLISVESSKLATLGEMSAGIAHEINNPLAVMMGRTELMINELKSGKYSSKDLESNLEKILKASNRIAKVVNGLKTFSRNGENDEFETALVESMVQDVLDFSGEKFKNNSIEIRLQIDPELTVNCRSAQIEQVILNLLSNSYDAVVGTPHPWILIEGRCDENAEQAVISITDSGDGIDEHIIPKIMQPFYTTKEVGRGTGLGLSISLGIVKSHQGDLYYDPSSKNTRFVIRIPIGQGVTI